MFFQMASDQYSVPNGIEYGGMYYSDIAETVKYSYIGVMDKIYNIFAWIDVFIDLDLLFGLLFLSLLYYGLRFASAIAKRIMGCFK